MRRILKKSSYATSEVVNVGDSTSNKDEAIKNWIHFIGKIDECNDFQSEEFSIKDLTELTSLARSITRR